MSNSISTPHSVENPPAERVGLTGLIVRLRRRRRLVRSGLGIIRSLLMRLIG
jgi:hypothetical protein